MNSYKYTFLFLFSLFLCTEYVYSQGYNTEVVAKIVLEENFNKIAITGTALNLTNIDQSLRYELSVFKGDKGSTNKSTNRQSGRFVLEPGEQKQLSVTSINKENNERIIILLLVYNAKDALIGKDRIVLNANEAVEKIILRKKKDTISNSLDTKFESADGIVLRGIVIEDTKTKIGSDFYKMFYIEYLQKNIKGREIVTIKEVLTIGSNTKIEIFVGPNIVAEFVLRPQSAYLSEMRDQSIVRVSRYMLNLEKNASRKKSY